jgi:hypothetical protein
MPDQADARLEPLYLTTSRSTLRTLVGGVLAILIVLATIVISARSDRSNQWHWAPAPISAGHSVHSQLTRTTLRAAR